jgi:hypothetical protein
VLSERHGCGCPGVAGGLRAVTCNPPAKLLTWVDSMVFVNLRRRASALQAPCDRGPDLH